MIIAQLDPGFTLHGFAARVGVEAIAALLSTLGTLAVAWFVFRRTTDKDREAFRLQIAHDLEMRRREDASRRAERDEIEQLQRRRLVFALHSEFEGNVQAIDFMTLNRPSRFPLRRALLDANLGDIAALPIPVAAALQKASLHIDQYNSIPGESLMYADSLMSAKRMIEDAAEWLALYLKGEVAMDETATELARFRSE
jgi:hypothetical protein